MKDFPKWPIHVCYRFSHSLNHLALGLCPQYILTLLLRFLTSSPVGLCIFITSHISLLSNSWAWPKHAHNITNLVASLTSFFASTQLKNGQKIYETLEFEPHTKLTPLPTQTFDPISSFTFTKGFKVCKWKSIVELSYIANKGFSVSILWYQNFGQFFQKNWLVGLANPKNANTI